MEFWKRKLECNHCSNKEKEPLLWCSQCNSLLEVSPIKGPPINKLDLRILWDLDAFLPKLSFRNSLSEGNTPILQLKNFALLKGLNIKLEYRNPTGSFRDRASSLITSHALSNIKKSILSVSTGSFGISLAAYCASAKLKSINIVPQNSELSKIEQLKIFNSEIIQSGETLNQAIKFAHGYIKDKNFYCPLPKENILTIEGQKTIGLEIAYQKKNNIKNIIVPQGSGSLIVSIYHGFLDALKSGWIEEIPKFFPVSLDTNKKRSYLIESLEFSDNDFKMINEVERITKDTEGQSLVVNPDDMIDDALDLAKYEGHFIEPASASVISAATILQEKDFIAPESTICVLTGSGINALNVFASKLRGVKKAVWGVSSSSTKKFEILNLIAENNANNGSEIWEALGKKKTRQSIYQHLNELENKGLIVSEMKTKKSKKYQLTRKGFEALDKMRDLIDLI